MTYTSPTAIGGATLNYTTSLGDYQTRTWQAVTATINAGAATVSAALPAGATRLLLHPGRYPGLSSDLRTGGDPGDAPRGGGGLCARWPRRWILRPLPQATAAVPAVPRAWISGDRARCTPTGTHSATPRMSGPATTSMSQVARLVHVRLQSGHGQRDLVHHREGRRHDPRDLHVPQHRRMGDIRHGALQGLSAHGRPAPRSTPAGGVFVRLRLPGSTPRSDSRPRTTRAAAKDRLPRYDREERGHRLSAGRSRRVHL